MSSTKPHRPDDDAPPWDPDVYGLPSDIRRGVPEFIPDDLDQVVTLSPAEEADLAASVEDEKRRLKRAQKGKRKGKQEPQRPSEELANDVAQQTLVERRKAAGLPSIPDTSHETIQRYVMDKLGEAGPIIFSEGAWWQYGIGQVPGVWTMFEEDRIWRAIQELNGLDTLEGATLNKPGKVIRVSKGLCESVSGLARARFRDKAAFAKAHSGFAAPSGFWACNSQEGWFERDPTPEDRCRLYVNVDPKISNDPPPVWTSILKRMWGHEPDYEQRVRFLHEWIGAMLAGTATKFQTCPILVGEGKNGKSVIIDIISALIPDQLRSNVSPSDLENNRFTSSLLVGKVLNVVAEIPATELMSSAIIKAVIDGSEILGERKNQDGFSLRCIAANLFSCNKLPPTRDISYGFFRRFAPLTCTAPEISEEERDMSIAQRVIATEHGAILGMAMQAYQDMLVDGRGYTQVPSVQAARHAWRGESDSVQMWVEEECERGGPTEIRALYDAYRKFANDTGSRAVSLGNFAHRLSALGYPPNGKSAKGDRQRDLRVRTQTSFASSSWTSSGWRSH